MTEEGINKYNTKDYRQSEFLFNSFHDSLLHAINGNTLGILTSPPQMYFAFFPKAQGRFSTNQILERSTTPAPSGSSRQTVQLIVKGRHPVVPPHSKLTCRPCKDFLLGNCPKPTTGPNKCVYCHFLFPRDYNTADCLEMVKWVDGANHLEWAPGPKAALEKLKASGSL